LPDTTTPDSSTAHNEPRSMRELLALCDNRK
jgi:hypothetical protein